MMELGPKARNLIELARREDDPDDATRERAQEVFLARLNASFPAGAGPADGTVPLAGSNAAGAEVAATKSLLGLKGAVLLAASVAVGGGGWALYSQGATHVPSTMPLASSAVPSAPRPGVKRSERDQPAPGEQIEGRAPRGSGEAALNDDSEPTTEARRKRIPSTDGGRAVPAPGRASVSAKVARDDSERAPSSPPPSLSPSPSPPSGTTSAASPSDALLAEARALRDVQQALRAGQSSRALALLADQERRFASGQLIEARAAARAMALCANQSGADRGKIAARFEESWSRSALSSTVRAACGVKRASVGGGD